MAVPAHDERDHEFAKSQVKKSFRPSQTRRSGLEYPSLVYPSGFLRAILVQKGYGNMS